ncbi:MAG: exosortase/archaeosortase family protein [Phycisphaerales bacterium]|nr:exosortase/archaeosortase family protein [Phycisphaerales bacterium]
MPPAGTASSAIKPDAPASVWTSVRSMLTPAGWTIFAVLAAGFAAVFFRWFLKQNQLSSHALEDWGHSYVMPLLVAFVLWQRRAALRTAPVEVFWPALMPLLVGVLAYYFFIVGVPNHMLQGWAVLMTLFSLVLLVAGPAVGRLTAMPIAMLLCAVTISDQIMFKVTWALKLMAAQASYVVLKVLGLIAGFSVDVTGNRLDIVTAAGKDIPLNVADACSGMRMVVAFVALGGAVALLGCKHWWQRIAIVLLATPVALVMNVVRVVILGLLTLFNPDLAAGDAHTLIGTILLFPSLLTFLGVVWVLNRLVREPATPKGAIA